jgi:DNA-binding beta-propeller fold protein YncE
VRRSGRLLAGLDDERSFWSESWIAHTRILSDLIDVLRASRPVPVVESDDGWRADRDLSLAVGRWGWLDMRVLVEEHAAGRCLLRLGTRLRFSSAGVAYAFVLGTMLASSGLASMRGASSLAIALLVMSVLAMLRAAWRTSRAMAVVSRAFSRVAAEGQLLPLAAPASSSGRARNFWRVATPVALTATMLALVIGLVGFGYRLRGPATVAAKVVETAPAFDARFSDAATGGGVAVGLAGDLFVADPQEGVIRRLRPRPPAGALWRAADIGTNGDPVLGTAIPFDAAADLTLAPNGDLFIADARHNRIGRITPFTGRIDTIAGSGIAAFGGDGRAARVAALNGPTAIALAQNGDLYVADTLNNRIRVVTRTTGLIRTVAGDGRTGIGNDVGDGRLAILAHLSRPTGLAIDDNGDLYIADTGHHRIRKISSATGVIATLAGDGVAGSSSDGAPASTARLDQPTGLALSWTTQGISVYIADSGNNRIRVINPDGTIGTLKSAGPLMSPTRLAFHPAGWLYVKDASPDGVTAIAAPPASIAPDRRAQVRTGARRRLM